MSRAGRNSGLGTPAILKIKFFELVTRCTRGSWGAWSQSQLSEGKRRRGYTTDSTKTNNRPHGLNEPAAKSVFFIIIVFVTCEPAEFTVGETGCRGRTCHLLQCYTHRTKCSPGSPWRSLLCEQTAEQQARKHLLVRLQRRTRELSSSPQMECQAGGEWQRRRNDTFVAFLSFKGPVGNIWPDF